MVVDTSFTLTPISIMSFSLIQQDDKNCNFYDNEDFMNCY